MSAADAGRRTHIGNRVKLEIERLGVTGLGPNRAAINSAGSTSSVGPQCRDVPRSSSISSPIAQCQDGRFSRMKARTSEEVADFDPIERIHGADLAPTKRRPALPTLALIAPTPRSAPASIRIPSKARQQTRAKQPSGNASAANKSTFMTHL